MSKMIITDQVINDHVNDVVYAVYNLENVITQLAEDDMSLNGEFEELKKIVNYINGLKQPFTDALHLYYDLKP